MLFLFGGNSGNQTITKIVRALALGQIQAPYWSKLIAKGKLKTREDIAEGLETFPETLLKLFRGENIGKLVLKV